MPTPAHRDDNTDVVQVARERVAHIERVRVAAARGLWSAIVLGLGFTVINVQQFAAGDALPWSLPWLAAWLLDPIVSVGLLALLAIEHVLTLWGVPRPRGLSAAKWAAFACTYTANTWASWATGDAAQIVLHSIPPVMVLVFAEAGPRARAALTLAIEAATADARQLAADREREAAELAAAERAAAEAAAEREAAQQAAYREAREREAREQADRDQADRDRAAERETRLELARIAAAATVPANGSPAGPRTQSANSPANGSARKSADEFADMAAAAWEPGTEVTAAWVKEVTGCGKTAAYKVLPMLHERLPDNVVQLAR